MLTTCIGSYPKPSGAPLADWFDLQRDGGKMSDGKNTRNYTRAIAQHTPPALEALFEQAIKQILDDQINAGIDIPTDGEARRENYIHYHCRHLTGFDFEQLTQRQIREGAAAYELPTIRGAINIREIGFLARDYKMAQALSSKPVKVTVPGPLTIMDTCADNYYHDRHKLHNQLAECVNKEVRALAEAGCRYIQLDEPLLARQLDDARAFAMEGVAHCFYKADKNAERVLHICCGYPEYLDQDDYAKADIHCYNALADDLDRLPIQQLSIEDAHCHNNLSLLEKFNYLTIVLGVIAVAKSAIETADEIETRIRQALEHIDLERLMIAPDCGLGLLSREQAIAKLTAMCQAVKRF